MFVNPFGLVYTLLYTFGLLLVRSFVINTPFVKRLQVRFPVVQQANMLVTLVLWVLLLAFENWIYSGWLDSLFGALTIGLAFAGVLKVYQFLSGRSGNPLTRNRNQNGQS